MEKNLSIIKTLTDKALLGQFIKDPDTWRAWFTFLRVFFRLSPESGNGDVELYKLCTGRHVWPVEALSEAWLIIGTRGGKSFITALIATYLAVFKEYELSPGELGFILIVAPTKKQARIIKGYLSSFFTDNHFLSPYLARETGEQCGAARTVSITRLTAMTILPMP